MLRSQGLRRLCVLSFALLAASTVFAQVKVGHHQHAGGPGRDGRDQEGPSRP